MPASRLRRPQWVAGFAVALALVLAGCTPPGTPVPVPTVTALTQVPESATSVLPSADAAGLALQASRAFFSSAPVAVVAPAGDAPSELTAASIAAGLGVPVLLAGGDATVEAVTDELARLGTGTVLGVGELPDLLPDSDEPEDGESTASPASAEVVAIPAQPESRQILGRLFAEQDAVAAGGQVAALSALDVTGLSILRLEGAPAPTALASEGPGDQEWTEPTLPVLAETARVNDVTVISDGSPPQAAAVGTARAAGATVLTFAGGDPRASSEAIEALALAQPATVVALGPSFGAADELAWRVATAATGVELPGGTQLVFGAKRYAALYGTPGSGALGVLGEQGTEATIARARQHAAALQPFTQDLVLPSLEIIASIASAGAGPDGDYSNTRPVSELRPLVQAAGDAGLYVVLDLQPGRTDFLTQARMYEELLLMPHVGLALDPEWRLLPHQRHLVQIGSVGIDEVNSVVAYLADLVRTNNLPQKLLILHQFKLSMIRDRDRLDTSRAELAMMIHVDGQGPQPAKTDTWNALRAGAPDVYWGWKNFYDEDVPMLNPEQTMRVAPMPHLVSYQ